MLRLLITIILILALPACDFPRGDLPTPDETAMVLSVAQTMTALYTPPPAATDTPVFTETASATPTPLFTPTSSVPMVSVSVDTNCRIGPGQAYDWGGGLQVGEMAEVVGRDPSGEYYYIRNPDVPASFCWLWGRYATISGDTSSLAVMTPPPTPTPAPSVAFVYDSLDACVANHLEFRVTNTGPVTWESFRLTVTDLVTSTTTTYSDDKFAQWNGCLYGLVQQDLMQSELGYINSGGFIYNPTGHSMQATLRVCSQNGLAGTCLEQTITFTP